MTRVSDVDTMAITARRVPLDSALPYAKKIRGCSRPSTAAGVDPLRVSLALIAGYLAPGLVEADP